MPDLNVATNALVFHGDGSARNYTLNISDVNTGMKLEWAGPGYTLTAATGERWNFTTSVTLGSTTNWFLTTHADPQGHFIQFTYDWNIPITWFTLVSITDPDEGSTYIAYTNSGPYGNLISSVTAPDGRVCRFTYDGIGRLTNIVNMAGLNSAFNYDSTNNLRTLSTPYGSTTFSTWAAGTNWASLRVAEGGLATNFWLYLEQDQSNRLSTNYTARLPILPSTLPTSWDTNEAHLRNTFFWNQRSIELLSDTFRTNLLSDSFDPANVTSNDFKLARQQHWLRKVTSSEVPSAVFKPACEECSLFDVCLPKATCAESKARRLSKHLFQTD